jgi:multiple sugar transport system substrate-binding protein
MTDRLPSGRLSRRSLMVGGGSLLLISTIVQACGTSSEAPTPTTAPAALRAAAPTRTTAAAPTAAPAAQTVPKSIQAVTIRYAGLTSMGQAVIKYTKDWLDSNQITVQLSTYDWQSLPRKVVEAAATRTYLADLIQLGPNESIALKAGGQIEEVPSDVQAQTSLETVLPIYRRLLSYNGKVMALPYDGANHFMAFRADLFKNADYQAAFKSKYSYDLDPIQGPKNWAEHDNYAEFFTGNDWNKSGGKDAFGFAHMTRRNDTLFWGFFARAAGYGKHPDDPGFFFDTRTMKPRINNPPFVHAIAAWKTETTKFSPPGGATQLGWTDVITAYVMDRVAMCSGWGAHGTAAQDLTQSKIKGLSRYAMTPGAIDVYNSSSGQWEKNDQTNRAPYIAFGGWALQMLTTSQQKDAAWRWGAHAASPPVSNLLVTMPTGANPIRTPQLEDLTIWTSSPAKWDKDEAASYQKAIKDTITHPNLVADLRILGFYEYVAPLELGVARAMSGQQDPQAALDEVAAAWTQLNDKFGVDKQREAYLDALGANQ